MTRSSAREFLLALTLLGLGIAAEWAAPPWWPMAWVHAILLQVAGMACLLDSIIRPADDPDPVLIGLMAVAAGLLLSP